MGHCVVRGASALASVDVEFVFGSRSLVQGRGLGWRHIGVWEHLKPETEWDPPGGKRRRPRTEPNGFPTFTSWEMRWNQQERLQRSDQCEMETESAGPVGSWRVHSVPSL